MEQDESVTFIRNELDEIKDHQVELHGGCVACHMIFRLKEKLESSEQNAADLLSEVRSEERRVGKECTSWCRSRWSPYH